MKRVVLPTTLLAQIRDHGRAAYPDECCGFLLGPTYESEHAKERTILALERAENEFEGERRRRFLIRPEELRDLEQRLDGSGRAVVGFYHSHPDHPARPSQFDQEHAWPWYTYLVLAVTANATPAIGAFELDADSSTFREVPLSVLEDSPRPSPVVRG